MTIPIQALARLEAAGYAPEEAQAVLTWLAEDRFDWDSHRRLLGTLPSPSPEAWQQWEADLQALEAGTPIQQVLGYAWFYGRKIGVSPQVLIPRPETEELVHWVLQDYGHTPLSVLDLCTGSGCIALTLAAERPTWHVRGLDISPQALEQARLNQDSLGLNLTWIQADILQSPAPSGAQVWVSNPPYVRPVEAALMSERVLLHEPHLALFTPEEDALLFYRRLLTLAQEQPSVQALYLEINEALGAETQALARSLGYSNLSLRQDLRGKDRMLRVRKSGT